MIAATVQFSWKKPVEQAIKNAAKRAVVGIGIPEDEKYPNGETVNDVAKTMEFGNGDIPPRPFLRRAISHDFQDWKASAARKLSKVLKGKTGSARMALKSLGNEVKESIVSSIEALFNPALAPKTIAVKAAKGRAHPEKPLIDSGRLKNSFRVVEMEGE